MICRLDSVQIGAVCKWETTRPNGSAWRSSQAIVPKELLPTLDTALPVGSGPYTLDSAQLNSRYVYKKSPTYRDASKGLPYIDEREVVMLIDPVAQ